jgi:hypothetical protein
MTEGNWGACLVADEALETVGALRVSIQSRYIIGGSTARLQPYVGKPPKPSQLFSLAAGGEGVRPESGLGPLVRPQARQAGYCVGAVRKGLPRTKRSVWRKRRWRGMGKAAVADRARSFMGGSGTRAMKERNWSRRSR